MPRALHRNEFGDAPAGARRAVTDVVVDDDRLATKVSVERTDREAVRVTVPAQLRWPFGMGNRVVRGTA